MKPKLITYHPDIVKSNTKTWISYVKDGEVRLAAEFSLPDLLINSSLITVEPEYPLVSEEILINFTVRNVGGGEDSLQRNAGTFQISQETSKSNP